MGIEEDTVLLIFPARITAQKRPLLLVDIMARLATNSLPVAALLLGTGELVSPVKAK